MGRDIRTLATELEDVKQNIGPEIPGCPHLMLSSLASGLLCGNQESLCFKMVGFLHFRSIVHCHSLELHFLNS